MKNDLAREILFRGKRKSDGEWIFGNLLQTDDDGICIIQNYVPHHLLKNYEVDPETVCQYTEWTNENDRKIFEGDIIKVDDLWMGIVVWDFNDTSFNVEPVDDDMEKVERLGVVINGNTVEDIGNIFDNPELLKGNVK